MDLVERGNLGILAYYNWLVIKFEDGSTLTALPEFWEVIPEKVLHWKIAVALIPTFSLFEWIGTLFPSAIAPTVAINHQHPTVPWPTLICDRGASEQQPSRRVRSRCIGGVRLLPQFQWTTNLQLYHKQISSSTVLALQDRSSLALILYSGHGRLGCEIFTATRWLCGLCPPLLITLGSESIDARNTHALISHCTDTTDDSAGFRQLRYQTWRFQRVYSVFIFTPYC